MRDIKKDMKAEPTHKLIKTYLIAVQTLAEAIEAEQNGLIPDMPILILIDIIEDIKAEIETRLNTPDCQTCQDKAECFSLN